MVHCFHHPGQVVQVTFPLADAEQLTPAELGSDIIVIDNLNNTATPWMLSCEY